MSGFKVSVFTVLRASFVAGIGLALGCLAVFLPYQAVTYEEARASGSIHLKDQQRIATTSDRLIAAE